MTWAIQPRSYICGAAAITCGTGANALLLHGVGLRAEAWGAQLGLPLKITAPDMPGHGESPHNVEQSQLEDFVLSALKVLSQLDAPTFLIGHSMGAMLALELACRAPSRVRAVAALNAVFERSTDAAHAVQNRAATLDGATLPDQSSTLKRWFGDETSPERDACAKWLGDIDPSAYKNAYMAFAHSKIPDRKQLSELRCPALFMTGSEEPNSTPAMSEAMAQCAPLGQCKIIQGAAHMMPMTHGTEVNAALLAFINKAAK
ncbi:MAG: alpha/beta hydrolase [Pseudomonadota bacterium]